MDSQCLIDGGTLSRFLDGELSPSLRLEIAAHLRSCPSCALRLNRFRIADGLVSQGLVGGASRRRAGGQVASLSLAAALVASLAANVLLTRSGQQAPGQGLKLSAAPSQTLTSFYEKMADPPARP